MYSTILVFTDSNIEIPFVAGTREWWVKRRSPIPSNFLGPENKNFASQFGEFFFVIEGIKKPSFDERPNRRPLRPRGTQTARRPVVLVRVRGPARHATADRRGGAIADCRVRATAPLRGTQPAVKKGGLERAALSGRLDLPPTAQAARFNSRSPSGRPSRPVALQVEPFIRYGLFYSLRPAHDGSSRSKRPDHASVAGSAVFIYV